MKAIAIDGFGVPPSLHDLPVPEPGEGEVLARVEASSVNGRLANRHAMGTAAGEFHRLASGGTWPGVHAAPRPRPSAYADTNTRVSIC